MVEDLVEMLNRANPVLRDVRPPEPGGWPMFLDPDVAVLEYRLIEERALERASKEWWGQPRWGQPGLFAAQER